MSLNESIVEDAALEWFGELGDVFLNPRIRAPLRQGGELGRISEAGDTLRRREGEARRCQKQESETTKDEAERREGHPRLCAS